MKNNLSEGPTGNRINEETDNLLPWANVPLYHSHCILLLYVDFSAKFQGVKKSLDLKETFSCICVALNGASGVFPLSWV